MKWWNGFCVASDADPLRSVLEERRQEKRKRKGKYTKSQVGYISALWGADPVGTISTKIGKVVGVHDVVIQSNFGFNIFRGFRSTGSQNFRFPIDFAGHRYNSAAATVQPVIVFWRIEVFGNLYSARLSRVWGWWRAELHTQRRTCFVSVFCVYSDSNSTSDVLSLELGNHTNGRNRF